MYVYMFVYVCICICICICMCMCMCICKCMCKCICICTCAVARIKHPCMCFIIVILRCFNFHLFCSHPSLGAEVGMTQGEGSKTDRENEECPKPPFIPFSFSLLPRVRSLVKQRSTAKRGSGWSVDERCILLGSTMDRFDCSCPAFKERQCTLSRYLGRLLAANIAANT